VAGDLAEAAHRRLPLILSLTASELAGSLAHARIAARLGVDAVLWQPPPGSGLETIADGIARLAGAAGLPLMLQDIDFAGSGFPLDWIVDLFARGNGFASLKVEIEDAGPKYSAVLAATGGALHVAGGWAVRTMTDALARGVHAFIPTEMEPLYVAIDRMWRGGDCAGAEALFAELLPVLAFANRDLDHSIRFLKRMRWHNAIFATARVRVDPAEMSAADVAEADRLIALATRLAQSLPEMPHRH
jgi:4-hydroxy-tetrahydrodipicolinate synthase